MAKNPNEARTPRARSVENPKISGRTERREARRRGRRLRRPRTASVRTWEVAEEGDGGGAADDGVDPEPPPGPEDGAGDARAHDRPSRQEVVVVHRPAVAASDSDAGKGRDRLGTGRRFVQSSP